jgi:type I restriction enzyme M protein
LRKSLVGTTDAAYREKIDAQIAELRAKAEPLRLQARDAQAAGDRIYWPIFNLDIKNPNAPEEETHDPDVLLEKYKKLLGEIEETENQLKSELAAALAHHFSPEADGSMKPVARPRRTAIAGRYPPTHRAKPPATGELPSTAR